STNAHQNLSSPRTQLVPLPFTVKTTWVNTTTNNLNNSLVGTLQTMYYDKANVRKSNPNTTAEHSVIVIQETNLTEVPHTKADKNPIKNPRTLKRVSPYLRLAGQEAKSRLGIKLTICATPVRSMLEHKSTSLGPEMILKAKKIIYESLVRYIKVAGFPARADADLKEANINDVVAFTIYPILARFKQEAKQEQCSQPSGAPVGPGGGIAKSPGRDGTAKYREKTGRDDKNAVRPGPGSGRTHCPVVNTEQELRLLREKQITSVDSSTGGLEESVVMSRISGAQSKYVLVVEAKKDNLDTSRIV
ncbi:hypothetical protein HOY82DRAFT_624781, partial [Tuber indicum]